MASSRQSTQSISRTLTTAIEETLKQKSHLVVGIDGGSASGKSTLAQSLHHALTAKGVSVLPMPLDHFHHPAAIRYRQGRSSLAGYVEDSFDLAYLSGTVLQPFQSALTQFQWHPRHLGSPDAAGPKTWIRPTSGPAVLLLEGVMLFRPPVQPFLHLCIRIDADEDLLIRRGVARDGQTQQEQTAVRHAFCSRYLPGQQRYIDQYKPHTLAHHTLRAHEDGSWERIVA